MLVFILSPLAGVVTAQADTAAVKADVKEEFLSLKQKKNTPEKVDQLIDLFERSGKEHVVCYEIIEEAVTIAEKILYREGLAKAYLRKGQQLRYEQKYHESVKAYKYSLSYFDKTSDSHNKAFCLNELGTTYRKLNLERDAFETYLKCLDITNKTGNTKIKAFALNGIGNLFIDLKQYKPALLYFRQSLNLEIKHKNLRGLEYNYANIGEVYIYLNRLDSAEVCLQKAIEYAKQRGALDKVCPEYILFGLLYQKKHNFEKSNEYFQRAIDCFSGQNRRYLANALINIGINRIKMQQFEEAKEYIEKGIVNAREVGTKENELLGYNALVEYYTQKEQYQKAFRLQEKGIRLKDSIINEVAIQSIHSARIAHETLEMSKKNEQLMREKNEQMKKNKVFFYRLLFGTLFFLLLFAALLALFLLYRKNTKLELENMQTQLRKVTRQERKNKKQKDAILAFNLSKKERELLEYIIREEMTYTQIAEEMHLSINTLKTHTKNIYRKLDVKKRIEVIKKIKNQ